MNDYQSIKQRMLDNNNVQIDKREGSYTNNLVSGMALENEKVHQEIDYTKNAYWLRNGISEFLDLKVDEVGLSRKEGAKATGIVKITGDNGTFIPSNSVIDSGGVQFITLEDVSIGNTPFICHVEAIEIGKMYNLLSGNNFALTNEIIGVSSIVNESDFAGGVDRETDEELRDRFYLHVRKNSTSGNVNHYHSWAMEVDGVGGAKVYPLWNGGGTVKVVVCDSLRTGADQQLVEKVASHIEDVRPIGATVTVVSAVEKVINISVTVVPANGYNKDQIKADIIESVTKFLYDNAFVNTYVSVARIGNLILDTNGVFDYSNFTVNGSTANIQLADNEVPVLGTVEVVV